MSAELPSDPKAVKKMEKAIAREARADKRGYERALEELKRTEKSEVKASNAANKADKHLRKMEDKEHNMIKSLQKATHVHDRAMTDLHTAQSDVQIQKHRAQRLRQDVDKQKAHADELFKSKQIRDEERGRKLGHLRG